MEWAILLLIIGIAAIVLTQLLARGRGGAKTRKTALWIGMILVLPGVIGLVSPGTNLGFFNQEVSFGGEVLGVAPETQPGVGELCAIEDTTVTLSGIDKYTAIASSGTHRYRINNAPALTVSDAGTFTASPGDSVNILWMNGSETQSNYFSDISTEIIPCVGTKVFSKELIKNSTVTIDVFNEDGNKIDAKNNETLDAGDVTTLTARIKGQFQKGQPYGGVIICNYNNTDFDDCIVDFGGEEVNVPQIYSLGGNRRAKAYSIPAIFDTEQLDGTVTIDVDDTNNPYPDIQSALNLTYYPSDYFINEDLGGIYDGPAVEDEDDTQTKAYFVTSDIFIL